MEKSSYFLLCAMSPAMMAQEAGNSLFDINKDFNS